MMTRKRKTDWKSHKGGQSPKKLKSDDTTGVDDENLDGDPFAEFEKFCKVIREHLSIEQMRTILKANNLDPPGPDDIVALLCQDILFYGPPDKCLVCGGTLELTCTKYSCRGDYSEYATCTFETKYPPRKDEPIKLPESVQKSAVSDVPSNHSPLEVTCGNIPC
ncbi:Poly [ADP-ribose] polymerase 3 [Sarracenia purpurea var. burkii]